MTDKQYIIYIGGYADEDMVKERGILHNPAGSNRMRRLAEALKTAGHNIMIVSTATSKRMKLSNRVMYRSRLRSAGRVPIFYCAALGMPLIGVLGEPIFLFFSILRLCFRRKVSSVIIYNFNPAILPAALWLRFCLHVPLILDLEDISIPKLSDWLPHIQPAFISQLRYAAYMTLMLQITNKIIVPTINFVSFIPRTKPYLVLPGCINVSNINATYRSNNETAFPINILYSGKIEFEHGIKCLFELIRMMEEDKAMVKMFHVHICGYGSKVNWFKNNIKKIKETSVQYYGFVKNEEYKNLLSIADICVVLQDPAGRFSQTNVPSKAYEYLGHGKMVMATAVGDLALLPRDVITIYDKLSAHSLYEELKTVLEDPQRIYKQGNLAKRYSLKQFDYSVTGRQMSDFIMQNRRVNKIKRM